MTAPALDLGGVSAGYGRVRVLADVDVTVPAGSVVALLGANGAGKTTLLRVAAGLLRATSGTVRMFGDDVSSASPVVRARRGLTMMPEGRGIFPGMTVRDNIYVLIPRRDRKEALDGATALFPELSTRLGQEAGTLSGGEQQMLALARCYVRQPKLILLDEISMGLAPLAIDRIYERVRSLAEAGTAVMLVEQYVHRALGLASYAYVLTRGRIAFSGPAAELGRDEVMARYLGTSEGPIKSDESGTTSSVHLTPTRTPEQ